MNGRVAAVAVLVMATLAGCTSTTPVISSQARPTAHTGGPAGPGADGIGDPYYPKAGNGGYDVASYDLDLRYDPASRQLTGTAKITATATAGLTRFNLDLRALTVESVTIDGQSATAKASGDELEVTPAQTIAAGSTFVTSIRYGGVPKPYREEALGGGEVGFLSTPDGAIAIGQPEVAASWYPVNDHPRDKATYTVAITVPDGLTAMSNGVLGAQQSANGWTTWHWSESKPMASYLATVVIGNYRVQQSTHDGKPVFLAVHESLDPRIDTLLARTPQIVDFLETKFGPYPFDALGGIVVDDARVRFALENQTRPIYGLTFFQPTPKDDWVIVHELAHQWYGDSVSIGQWSEIWLNEGFATYAEWMWSNRNGGLTEQQTFDRWYSQGAATLWTVPPGRPGVADLFANAVYVRGAMTLHALRMTIGDDAFFTVLRTWAAEHADGNVTTAQFVALAERISGKHLTKLFQDWLYGTTRPARP